MYLYKFKYIFKDKIPYEFVLILEIQIQEQSFSFNLICDLTSVFPCNHVENSLVSVTSTHLTYPTTISK